MFSVLQEIAIYLQNFSIFEVKQAQMRLKVAKAINLIVIILMSIEIVGASFAVLPSSSDNSPIINFENPSSSIIDSFFFEKTEETNENNEEENDHMARVILVDFSCVARSLSAFHSSDFDLSVHAVQDHVGSPVYQVNCVFLL
jgi:hypothetical protein